MTLIVTLVDSLRLKFRQETVAESYLSERGFVKGQHYQTLDECVSLAAVVIVELASRSSQKENGFYGFEAECKEKYCAPECRGWDGRSKKCDCGTHFVRIVITARNFPAVDHEIACCCCDFCDRKPFDTEPKCAEQHRHCDRCWSDHREHCFG